MQTLHNPNPNPAHALSSWNAISSFSLIIPHLSFRRPSTLIRMGGGPRTYPGGVSKWQWKRMQSNKAKQLLKARLSRERQIYEMRKRAELKAAIADLERPWEVVSHRTAPKSALFSVAADEQLKVLADRFQRPGGFDLWADEDGPQLFQTPDGVPTARFFPKGVVHSVKPYGPIADEDDGEEESRGVHTGNSSRGYHSQPAQFGTHSDALNPFDSGVELNSNSRPGVSNGRNIQKHRARFDNSHGSQTGVGLRNSRGRRNGMNSRSGKFRNGSFVKHAQGLTDEPSRYSGSKSTYGGKNKHDNERGQWDSNNGTDERPRFSGSKSSYGGKNFEHGNRKWDNNGNDERSRFSGSRSSSYGGKNERESRRWDENATDERSRFSGSKSSYGGKNFERSNGRAGGYRVGGNGVKVKDLGGRGNVSSNTDRRSNGRKWPSRGNAGRFGGLRSEDVYDMSLQRDGSYGFSDRVDDAMN